MASEERVLFAKGVALFNDGEYFACHEVWEELWKRSAGEERIVLQGMIQAAAALLHAQRGNRRGALSVYRKALINLAGGGKGSITGSSGDFRNSLDEYFKAVEKGLELSPPRIAIDGTCLWRHVCK